MDQKVVNSGNYKGLDLNNPQARKARDECVRNQGSATDRIDQCFDTAVASNTAKLGWSV